MEREEDYVIAGRLLRKKHGIAWILMLAVAATQTGFGAEPPRVAFSSIGNARIGMREAALVRALGGPLRHVDSESEEDGCYYVSGPGFPEGTSLMMLDGRLARIAVSRPDVRTVSGASVGMSEDALKRLYHGRLTQQPHAYVEPDGLYLTLRSRGGEYGIRFETDGSVVTGFYAGTGTAIQYIEGCQ